MIAWFARSRVAANLLMGLIVLGGVLTAPSIPRQFFPHSESGQILVTVVYPGAGPAEVEQGICVLIEDRLEGMEEVRRVRSRAVQGLATVTVELLDGVDARRALDEVDDRISAIDDFPADAEQPRVQEVEIAEQVTMLAVHGQADAIALRRAAETVRTDLLARHGVSRIEIVGAPLREIAIEVAEHRLLGHGLTLGDIAAAVRSSSLDVAAGTLRHDEGHIRIRSRGQAYDAEAFASLPIRQLADGSRLLLGDLATVRERFEEDASQPRFDNHPALFLAVFRVGDEQTTAIAAIVRDYIENESGERLAEGLRLSMWQDESRYLASQLEVLTKNALAGFILVVITLSLVLRPSLAFWISLGIPVAFLGAFWMMPLFDLSIDLLTLFAFLVVLGIVVDDAIVVGENIHRQHEAGFQGVDAAIRGAREIALPVIVSMATTIAAFAPLLAVPGNAGQVMSVIPKVVILVLVFSLAECLLILPAHMVHTRPRGERPAPVVARLLQRLIDRVYRPLLDAALEARGLTLALALACLLWTVGLVAGGHLRFTFFPPIEAENVVALLTMPQGTSQTTTGERLAALEASAQRLQTLAGEDSPIRHIVTSVGSQPFVERQSFYTSGLGTSRAGSHLGEVNLELAPAEQRTLRASELLDRWRRETTAVTDAVELRFDASLFTAGRPIELQLSADEEAVLATAAAAVEEALTAHPATFGVTNSQQSGVRELDIRLTDEGEALGLTRLDVARQVRRAFFGEEVQRLQRGSDEIRVMVRYPEANRRSMADLERFRVRAPNGADIPLSVVAELRTGRGATAIDRSERRRVVTLGAELDTTSVTANQVVAELESGVLEQLRTAHGVKVTWKGEQEDQAQAMGGLMRGFVLAAFVIYALLAIGLQSYSRPLVVMIAIPFAWLGAFWGHWLLGIDLTLYSIFGLVALSGVIVNDSLVLVDFAEAERRRGATLGEALVKAGRERARPIILTSVTTFVGLSPLIAEQSLQAQFLIPMAVSIAFGILFGTFIVLLMVPVVYRIVDGLRPGPRRPGPSAIESSPASLEPLIAPDSSAPSDRTVPSKGDL